MTETMLARWPWLLLCCLLLVLWSAGRGDRSSRLPANVASGAIAATTGCPTPAPFADAGHPRQSEVAGVFAPFRLGDANVSPLAGFSLQARVLGRKDYSWGKEADYSPTDLALGWGPMAEPGMADRLHVRQDARWYRYSWGGEGPPMTPDQIRSNSANMHMIPANASVAYALARVAPGELIRVNGWLVRIESDGGFHWNSSLSRDDTGAGACELVFVCSIAN